jgi:hypothetical protein
MQEVLKDFCVHTYEKLTFEGHQALKLLAIDERGKMAVNRIMKSM